MSCATVFSARAAPVTVTVRLVSPYCSGFLSRKIMGSSADPSSTTPPPALAITATGELDSAATAAYRTLCGTLAKYTKVVGLNASVAGGSSKGGSSVNAREAKYPSPSGDRRTAVSAYSSCSVLS
eukprot:424367-Prorocentrum_minimum.AAC.1